MTTQNVTKIGEVMTKKIETIGSASTAQEIAKKMKEKKVSSVIVVDDNVGTPLGIINERDLVTKVCVTDNSSKEISSKHLMSSALITISPDSSPSDAAELMIQNRVRHLLVVTAERNQDKNKEMNEDKGLIKPIGLITPLDFTRSEVMVTSEEDKDSSISKILDHY